MRVQESVAAGVPEDVGEGHVEKQSEREIRFVAGESVGVKGNSGCRRIQLWRWRDAGIERAAGDRSLRGSVLVMGRRGRAFVFAAVHFVLQRCVGAMNRVRVARGLIALYGIGECGLHAA